MTTDPATEPRWLQVVRGDAPLLVSFPHGGDDLAGLEPRLVSPWLARKDADWWIERLYDFAADLGATLLRTTVSRTVVDVNRDPSGASLYPGRATTGLCPEATFDGEALYPGGLPLAATEIAERRRDYFDPYHGALAREIARLRARHPRVVLYDAHSIRSRIPRLFPGELPEFNVGSVGGASADPGLVAAIVAPLARAGRSHVVDGRFRGGWITRHYGRPATGVHAVQMELACRAYLDEPAAVTPANWPAPFEAARASGTRDLLREVLQAALDWTRRPPRPHPEAT
ncbi:MAG TPA: N-formylglutamate deformylase [Burkholderiaceae bacterium]|nr:N-formylglutamate deformylase [Burkholderiaceae bacterium]